MANNIPLTHANHMQTPVLPYNAASRLVQLLRKQLGSFPGSNVIPKPQHQLGKPLQGRQQLDLKGTITQFNIIPITPKKEV